MREYIIVLLYEFRNIFPQLFGAVVFIEINLLCFQRAEPPLNHDVVRPPGLPVHALADMLPFKIAFIFFTGKLAALVAVQDGRHAIGRDGFFHGSEGRNGIQGVRQVPAYNLSAVPVNNRCEIHVAMIHLDVGDVHRPYLVGKLDRIIAEQVRHDRFLEITLGKVGLRVNGGDSHLPHAVLDIFPSNPVSLPLEQDHDLPASDGRHLGVPVVYLGHNFFPQQTGRLVLCLCLVVKPGAVDAKQFALPPDGKIIPFLDQVPGRAIRLPESTTEDSLSQSSAGQWSSASDRSVSSARPPSCGIPFLLW